MPEEVINNETNKTDGSTPTWEIVPLGTTDVEEFLDGSRVGSRRRDSNDNLFEIVPNCTIHRSDSTDSNQSTLVGANSFNSAGVLSTAGSSESIGIVLDSELLILEKNLIPQCARRIKFSAPIDFILWRRSIILVGLSSSEIVLVDPHTLEIKESKNVAARASDKGQFFVDAAIHSNPDPTKIDVIAVGSNGVAYLFPNISLSDGIMDSTHDQNISVDIDIGSIRGTRVKCLESQNSKVLCVSSPSRNILILGEADGTLSMHDLEDLAGVKKELTVSQSINVINDLGISNSVQIRKVVALEGLLFMLLSSGSLEILLDDVLFVTQPFRLPTASHIVHDFALVLTSESEVKLWVLYGCSDFSENYVGIFGGPSFDPEFSAKIPSLTINKSGRIVSKLMFPSQATSLEEPLAFLEISNAGTTVYRMLETSTEATIQKLLSRGRFDQAAALAKQYDKDLDVVYKTKARAKFNEMLADAKNSEKAKGVFDEITETLEKIRDPAFVCAFCSQKGFPKLEWIKEMLRIGKGRVKDCITIQAGKHLLLTLKKLYTFEQVFPNPTIQEWLSFVSEENTMFQQCKWFLNKHEFLKCERVWNRHFDEFIPGITLDNFGPFFFILFGQKLKSRDAVSLFKCILPYAVEKCAEANCDHSPSITMDLNESQLAKVNILVDIAKRQVCSLEREKCWPTEATEFSKIVISIVRETMDTLENSRSPVERKTKTQCLICKEILQRMEMIVQNLVELADLKQHHSIRIPFLDYINNDVIEVVNSMLCELFHLSEIETFISNFLTPFSRRKGIEVDKLFSEHVKTVISDLPFHINSIDIPQEERLICLISHVSNIEVKLRSVLAIAEEWPVPWSQNIDNMVVACLRINLHGDTFCNDLQNTINIMRVQVPFRCLLNKYRLTATKVQNYCGVVMALTRIIKLAKPEYYEDCLEFIKHTGFVDETKLKSIEFSLNFQNSEISVEDIVNAKCDMGFLKRLLARTLQEFKTAELEMFDEEEIKRIIETSKLLANIVDDRKAIEFLKLREFIPSLNDSDIVYDENYPFCALNHIMSASSEKSSSELIELLKKLSDITFTHLPDILVTAAVYYARPGGGEFGKLWDIIEKIVNTPGCILGSNSHLAQSSALTVAQFLICNCPDAPGHRLGMLKQFIVLLTAFEDNVIQATDMLRNLRIFLALREQEIPLEKHYLKLYMWIHIEGIPIGKGDPFFTFLRQFGSTILKFGDKNLFKQAFGCIQKEFYGRISGRTDDQLATRQFVKRIRDIQKELYRSCDTLTEPESNKDVNALVERLCKEADILVTPYALRQRNKSRFLEKLLGLNHYSLAAEVAIVFEVFTDLASWSKILKGFMNSGDVKALRKVLLDLRNISELWMLPEFASGWKMVSESDRGFVDLCPIPLD